MAAAKKYELTSDTININNLTLHRIRALLDFGDVKQKDLGGYIQSEQNLSQYNTAWVYDNARVCGEAQVYDNARVYGEAWVWGKARVWGE